MSYSINVDPGSTTAAALAGAMAMASVTRASASSSASSGASSRKHAHGLSSPPLPALYGHADGIESLPDISTPFRLQMAKSDRRKIYESLEDLKTMRSRLAPGAPTNQFTDAAAHLRSAETCLTRGQWREGAGSLLVSLAHNSGDLRASAGFRGAVDHIFRNRTFFEPGRRRESVDYGPVQRRERPPEEERPAPPPAAANRRRTIVDDFPEVWRQCRMEEIQRGGRRRASRTVVAVDGAVAVIKAHEDELEELRQVMHKNYYIPLRNIFRYYARLDGAKVKNIAVRSRKIDNDEMYTVSKYEFDAFVADCRVISGKVLPQAKVDLIFISANREQQSQGPAGQATLASDANTRLTMVLPEFLNAVVRLAEARYAGEGRGLAERLSLLMENHVLPNAKWDDVEEFRRLVRHPTVQEALAAARPQIRLLFEKYCGLDSLAARTYGAQKNKSVSIREFVAMFEDLGLLRDRALSQKDVQDAFATAQADPVIDDDVTQADDHGADCMEELNAVEFEEAIIRCAVARHCAEKDPEGGYMRRGSVSLGAAARPPLPPAAGASISSASAGAGAANPNRRRSVSVEPKIKSFQSNRLQQVDEGESSRGPIEGVRAPAHPASFSFSVPRPASRAGLSSVGSEPDPEREGEEGDGGTGMPPGEVALAVARFFEAAERSGGLPRHRGRSPSVISSGAGGGPRPLLAAPAGAAKSLSPSLGRR